MNQFHMGYKVWKEHVLVNLWTSAIAGRGVEPPGLEHIEACFEDTTRFIHHGLGADVYNFAKRLPVIVVVHQEVGGFQYVAAVNRTV